CSPGAFIYWDWGYAQVCPEQPFIYAALVMCRIISIPAENKLCLDLGHKSIAPENPLNKRVHFLNATVLSFIGQSEEHLVVEVEKNHQWKIGDVWYGVPIHICPTVALYDFGHEIISGKPASIWKTIARDRKITY
ncbi:MAG: D-TA family PLP-dependent enzyme, partial [Saprospiraceae bacterium]|nr:D-TA family PLP-dependent enzyme [Saprospiraceae bacterium]